MIFQTYNLQLCETFRSNYFETSPATTSDRHCFCSSQNAAATQYYFILSQNTQPMHNPR